LRRCDAYFAAAAFLTAAASRDLWRAAAVKKAAAAK